MNPDQFRRPGVHAVHSVNKFVFSVPDLKAAEHFFTSFGLDVRHRDNYLDLYTDGHESAWASIHDSGKPKRLEYVSFGIDAADEAILASRIADRGIACAAHPLSDGKGIWLRNPDDIPVQLVVTPKVSPSAKTQPTPAKPVAPGQGAAPSRSMVAQVRPRRLSHVLFFTPDVTRMVGFCESVLGLRMSDHSGDGIAFMHGAHGSDHHLVAFAKSHAPGLHHSSWDVGSIDEVGCGSAQMQSAGYVHGWGVGRHVLGSNYFYYVRDPWGSWTEFSADIDFIPHNLDWPAADHPPEDSLYVWGPALPEDFITNHEQPVTVLAT
jgi:catechol 2,3-dioxygenase-like lactoylglutathione lyase family enzyme